MASTYSPRVIPAFSCSCRTLVWNATGSMAHRFFLVSIVFSFRRGTPSIAGKRKESYSPEPTKNAAQTKQIGLIRKQIRSGCDGKALAPGHDHAVLPAGAVDDEEIPYAVVAADDSNVTVIRIKDEIAGQCV